MNNAPFVFMMGTIYQARGQFPEAIVCYRRAIELKGDYSEAHNNLGVILAAQGSTAEAIKHYESALKADPAHASAHNNLGNALMALGRGEKAVAHYERALALDPAHANAHNNLGNVRRNQGNFKAALAHFQRALELDPNHAGVLTNLANIWKERGDFAAALDHYDRALLIRPDYAEAHFHRAEIHSFHPGDGALEALEALAAKQEAAGSSSPFVHFALAKALEDIGDYARAFAHLEKGNARRRRQVQYDEPLMLNIFERTCETFDRATLNRLSGGGDASAAPIFVVGMPRSGSTLIEQILASHPQVEGLGEVPELSIAVREVLTAGNRQVRYPECVPALEAGALRRLGSAYLERLPALPAGKTRSVDKNLANFFRIGLIRLILPNARIIHAMRDPMDTCVSCYSHLFNSGIYFSYDLGELGRYYRRYQELMDHWRAVLDPGAMLEVSYEELVDDVEGQSRRLMEYCGLAWDERCLEFHKTTRSVKTASAVQVRKPLFRSSFQRWQKYEASLGPLFAELGHPAKTSLSTSDANKLSRAHPP
jgi:tetratricopeptide (TPR) repeat protein